MSIFDNWLTDGANIAGGKTRGQRLSAWLGRWLARRHGDVTVADSAMISPDARVSARKSRLVIGERTVISPGASVQGNVHIGHDSSVQSDTFIVGYGGKDDEKGRITIGNYVRIAGHCMIVGANHRFDRLDIPIHQQGMSEPKGVVIEDDVWIASNCVLLPGVRIGTGSVVGAGSIVTKDIPPRSIAVGNPAHVIRTRGEAKSTGT